MFIIPISSTLLDCNVGQFTDVRQNYAQGSDNSTSANISITEIGAFRYGTQPNYYNEMPLLYLWEPFHFEGNLSLSNGQPLGGECLNIYIERDTNERPFATVNSNNSTGNFQWYSDDPQQNPSLRGLYVPGKLEGIYNFSVAYEPGKDLSDYGGCSANLDSSSDDTYFQIDILVIARAAMEIVCCVQEGYTDNELVSIEVSLYRARTYHAIENEEVFLLRQYYSDENQWITDGEVSTTTNENGHALFEWEFEGKNCGGWKCQGLWQIIVYHPGSMFFSGAYNLTHELQYKQTDESTNPISESKEISWSNIMDAVEISALVISIISLIMYISLRKKGTESELDELADKIVSRQNPIQKNSHQIEDTIIDNSEITQKHAQTHNSESQHSDVKQDLVDGETNVKIVQNITYNIQDSSIVGDLNAVQNSDLE